MSGRLKGTRKVRLLSQIAIKFINRSSRLLYTGMRFFRNFPEFRNFPDLRGHYRGNPKSGLIFMGGGWGGTIYVCAR